MVIDIHLDNSFPLGRNGLHCIKFLHQMGKLLLNLTYGEPLSLMKKLPFFDGPIELDVLLEGSLLEYRRLCSHFTIDDTLVTQP